MIEKLYLRLLSALIGKRTIVANLPFQLQWPTGEIRLERPIIFLSSRDG